MATAAWGQRVLDTWPGAAPSGQGAGYVAHLERALAELHAQEPGGEERVAAAAHAAFLEAPGAGERATAAALLAAALALDPAPTGYRERLVDAHGLAMWAGEIQPATVLAQAARAFVAVACGRVEEGQKLSEVMSSALPTDPDARLFLGLARRYLAQRGDAALAALRAVLRDKPESLRARTALAHSLLELGLAGAVLEVAQDPRGVRVPMLDALRGRALVLQGSTTEGLALLREADAALPETSRGEVQDWMARALVQAGRLEEAEAIQRGLAQRAGFASEAALLQILLQQQGGDFAGAKTTALSLCQRRGLSLPVALECQWAVVDACAGAGDTACVEAWGKRARQLDPQHARYFHARAALSLVGGVPADDMGDVEDALRRAHLLSPLDPKLGKRVGAESLRGDSALAATLRGARRALAMDARSEAGHALQAVIAQEPGCRVCRALFARAARDIDENARRAVAALGGRGPPLDELDLLPLIDTLGGSPVSEGRALLEGLARDERPGVRAAATLALADLRDPEARARRKEAEAQAPAPAPGTVPLPHEGPPGASHAHEHAPASPAAPGAP